MNDDGWLSTDPILALLREVVEKAVKQYRISEDPAKQIVRESFAADQQLKNAALSGGSFAELKRTRAFKQAASDAKRSVYYHLRAYKSNDDQLVDGAALLQSMSPATPLSERERARMSILSSHASTRERLGHEDAFYEWLFATVDPPRNVLDVGSGVHPLMFPFEHDGARSIERYVAIDRDARVVDCVNAFGRLHTDRQLLAFPWDVADGWKGILRHVGGEDFDLALLMKLIPVVQRQQRDLLAVLQGTPARTWLLTGSTISLTKQASIERREKRVLREFLKLANRDIKDEFSAGEEFAWVVV